MMFGKSKGQMVTQALLLREYNKKIRELRENAKQDIAEGFKPDEKAIYNQLAKISKRI